MSPVKPDARATALNNGANGFGTFESNDTSSSPKGQRLFHFDPHGESKLCVLGDEQTSDHCHCVVSNIFQRAIKAPWAWHALVHTWCSVLTHVFVHDWWSRWFDELFSGRFVSTPAFLSRSYREPHSNTSTMFGPYHR